MNARAIWQGKLLIAKRELPVKLYSAVQDRQIHFHLLHKRDRTRVEQRMVDAETEKPVSPEETRKAFEAGPGVYVTVTAEEIERSVPEASREVRVNRFVSRGAIDPQLFDRPYYLGPNEDALEDYFALAEALKKRTGPGIASWVMRKHSYVGAVLADRGYLMLITLRHADEVIPVSQLEPPQGRALDAREKEMANQADRTRFAGKFEPDAYHDEFQRRVHEMIDAKRKGKKIKPKKAPAKRREGSLADALSASLKRVRGVRSA